MQEENNKKPTYKYLGVLDPNIAEYWNIEEHRNKPILVYEDRIHHVIDKHLKDFKTEENVRNIYNDLESVIKKPDYVFYNKQTKGLEYYKNINDSICVAVRINSGTVLKVKSWYPANKGKIENRRKKEEQEFIDV